MLASSYPFADLMWTLLAFFVFALWIWLVFTVWFDVFRRDDIGGLGKVAWLMFTLVLPFLGVFAYLITNGHEMARRSAGGGPWRVA